MRLIAAVLHDAGASEAEVFLGETTLPCYFRPTKDWDLVVRIDGDLIAVIEVKAHVGSFGNNFNNRVEEALGNATDFWAAYRESTFAPSAQPWLGYLMMLEDDPCSTRAGRAVSLRHFSIRPEFRNVSYAERYMIFCERLIRERLYSGACFLMSGRTMGLSGQYTQPNIELSFENFATSLAAHAAAHVRRRKQK